MITRSKASVPSERCSRDRERPPEVAAYRAAQAAVLGLHDLGRGVSHEDRAVDVHFAEFVLDDGEALAMGFGSRRLSSVVLPLPRKPVSTVTGIGSVDGIGCIQVFTDSNRRGCDGPAIRFGTVRAACGPAPTWCATGIVTQSETHRTRRPRASSFA